MDENYKLSKGESVSVTIQDDHTKHIKNHMKLLGDPIIRYNTKLVQGIMLHIKEHIDMCGGKNE